jgi:hypothetical protein
VHPVKSLRLIVVALALVAGCVTPLIPIPIPEPEQMELKVVDASKDLVTISGYLKDQHCGARIFVLNLQTGTGVIATSDYVGDTCKFTTPAFVGKHQDNLHIWAQRSSTDENVSVTVIELDRVNNKLICKAACADN